MTVPTHADHDALAKALRDRIENGPAQSDRALRRAAAERAAGGPPMSDPYDALARQIGEASERVTDAQVASVRDAAGSDRAAFEIIAAAAVGAGLMRWQQAVKSLGEAPSVTS